jgi:hypothetical protein
VKFDNGGVALPGSISLPTAAAGLQMPLTLSGTATTDGHLTLSTDGRYLTLAGYGVTTGLSDVADASAAAAPRTVARIGVADDAVDTSTSFTGDSTYGNDNARSVASTDGSQFWLSGSNEGVRYATLGATTSTQINTASPTNNRVVNIFDGQLYVSSGSGAFQGVSAVGAGLPTTGMQTISLLSGFPTSGTHSANDFWFKDGNTVYVADDSTFGNGGGIQKWTRSGATWSLAYTLLNTGAATTAVRGLAGYVDDASNVVLYGTTTQASANRLISVIDVGPSATATTLATAPVNTAFRGVEFVPDGAPANNADFDNSGTVDGRDFLTWQKNFGATGQADKSTGDATGGGTVNDADLAAWKSKFGGAPASAASVGVPEPGALALAALGVLAAAGRRRWSAS